MTHRPLALFIVGALVLCLAWCDVLAHLADLVWNYEAYSHGVWVPFVTLWLVWRKRFDVLAAGPKIWFPGLAAFGGLQFALMIGAFLEANIIQHLAFVFSLQALALGLLGLAAAKPIRFPLFFLLMVVPLGEQLVGPLQVITAKSVIWALDATGIPFKADGVLIELSSGLYQVARACAGVKFLFTSIVTGVLLCHLAFESWTRRFFMLVASVVVPILANGIRVYTILLIGEFTDQSFAKGVDHIVYGWGFLSIVLLLLIAGAYQFADRESVFSDSESNTNEASAPLSLMAAVMVALVFVLPVGIGWWTGQEDDQPTTCHISALEAPDCIACGFRALKQSRPEQWFVVDKPTQESFWHYREHAASIAGQSTLYYGEAATHRLGRSPMFSFPGGWDRLQGGNDAAQVAVPAGFAEMKIWRGQDRRLVWVVYRVGGHYWTSSLEAKLAMAWQRLQGQPAVGQRLMLVTPIDGSPDRARQLLTRFVSEMGLDTLMWQDGQVREEIRACAV